MRMFTKDILRAVLLAVAIVMVANGLQNPHKEEEIKERPVPSFAEFLDRFYPESVTEMYPDKFMWKKEQPVNARFSDRTQTDAEMKAPLFVPAEPMYAVKMVIYKGPEKDVRNLRQDYVTLCDWLFASKALEQKSQKAAYRRIEKTICKHVKYGREKLGDWTEAVESGKAVCHGYAELVMMLCWMAGIPCQYEYGPVKGEKVLHAWNRLWLDGSEYVTDVTWKDQKIKGYSLKKEFKDREVLDIVCTADYRFDKKLGKLERRIMLKALLEERRFFAFCILIIFIFGHVV